ncbi:MAG: HAMP domain-containing protein [Clostridia bacterium]|nr:HAMP domain-containing protein [Clostridia bacterium]
MKLKLFKKYFLTTAVIIIFSLAFMMIILSFVMNNYMAKSKQDVLTKACGKVTEYVETEAQGGKKINGEDFHKLLSTISEVSESDIFLADTSGKVFVCSCEEWKENSSCMHSAADIPQEKLQRDFDAVARLDTLNIYKEPHYVAVEPLIFEDELYGTVFVTAPISTVSKLLSSVTRLYLASALVPLVLMFFSIYAMIYRMTKPLKLMSEASRAMAKGDFSRRIPVMSDDEIGELSASFNMMTNSLSQLEGMRKSFVANVSHELKTPMTTIGGFIDGILDGTIEQEKQQYYLGIVSDEVKRLSRLVQSMLSMAKLESGEFVLKPELFDLRELICTIVVGQEQRIEERRLEIIGLDELQEISVNADRDLIHQAVYNLVDNAIKFTENGGKISFSLKTENKKAVLAVTNTGTGIPEKDLPFVFERFYKVDKSRSTSKNSTGLGLYIVKTIITAHGGNITVTTKEGQFTSFKVILP